VHHQTQTPRILKYLQLNAAMSIDGPDSCVRIVDAKAECFWGKPTYLFYVNVYELLYLLYHSLL
jgi:hypothetical protein